MKNTLRWLIIIILMTSVLRTTPVKADGIIIPEPPICAPDNCVLPPLPMQQLEIKFHHVRVNIENQIATTRVNQVFYNPNDYNIEGTYVFPLPLDAVVSQFILWVDGKAVEGKVLDADEARQIYEEIIQKMQDPALLEYVGRGAVQASITPIPSKGERRIELEFQQVLTGDHGLFRYQYPLNTEKFSASHLDSVIIEVNLQANQPIRAIYSPSHPVEVERHSDHSVVATYEASHVRPNTDFVLFYSTGEEEAFHLMSFVDPEDTSDPDGYFLMLLAPKMGKQIEVAAKDVILVLDRSGSMEGEKFRQAQEALIYILKHLQENDRFFVLTFGSNTEAYSNHLAPASEADRASEWINQLGAVGSTDIDRALREAAAVVEEERPTYLIFLTDGLPTRGVVDSNQILTNVRKELPGNVRLFPFGVGYDVDTFLLDSLAQSQHGLSMYVSPEEALDERLSEFYEKIRSPVLTDIELNFGGLEVYDVYPNPLPDLFEGNQIIIIGRYRQGKNVEIQLKGKVNGIIKQFNYPDQHFSKGDQVFEQSTNSLPRLWATRKIGYLLTEIRLNGADEETVEQIIRLSLRYGIVTPYTSYLITEEVPLGETAQREAIQDAYSHAIAQPTQPSFGIEAVQKAAAGGAMSQAEQPAPPSNLGDTNIRVAGNRTFVLKGEIWIDTTFDPETMNPERIEFLSNAYFELANMDVNLAAALAMGEQVMVVQKGSAIQIVPKGQGGIREWTATPGQAVMMETLEPNENQEQFPEPQRFSSWQPLLGGAALGILIFLLVKGTRRKFTNR